MTNPTPAEKLRELFDLDPSYLARIDDGRIVLHLTDAQFAEIRAALIEKEALPLVAPEDMPSPPAPREPMGHCAPCTFTDIVLNDEEAVAWAASLAAATGSKT